MAKTLSLKVQLVRVVHIGWSYPYEIDFSHTHLGNLETELVTDATSYLQSVRAELLSNDIDVEWKILRGSAASALVELARGDQHDLVVMSTHGRSGLSRWVLWSVAEAVVRASQSPVLVIPPKAE